VQLVDLTRRYGEIRSSQIDSQTFARAKKEEAEFSIWTFLTLILNKLALHFFPTGPKFGTRIRI
jgi:hypothetical protein